MSKSCAIVAAVILATGGCTVLPNGEKSSLKTQIAERDLLADAAKAVETTPWPKPTKSSILSRLTGGAGESVSRDEAVEIYVSGLRPMGERFWQLVDDAEANISAAERLDETAMEALYAPRLSMNDVVVIEAAIQNLREHRQIVAAAAKALKKHGEPVNDIELGGIRNEYASVIKSLGNTADVLADKIDDDASRTLARPMRLTTDSGS